MTAFNMETEQINTLTERFQKLNRIRLERTQAVLTDRQQEFLEILPLLFHINHPTLPGYVSSNCPMGVPNFKPSTEALSAAKRLAKSFSYKARGYRQFDIQAIYLMGSPGTIAFSEKSDFDAWVCFRESLEPEHINELNLKAERIMDWANSIHLEVTIFLVNPSEFRQGKTIPLSYESSGSSQHLLLLEEFYRTAIVLAGKYPLWWIVPPEQEHNYEQYIQMLEQKRLFSPQEYIDLGSVANIHADEFLGAALWHIYKGIDSPYKSIMKLMLMESYASEYPNIKLLSSVFKQHVYNDEKLSPNAVDPYLLMLEKLSDYIIKHTSQDRLELLRQCFYLKVHYPVSSKKHKPSTMWRYEMMKALTDSWEWDLFHLTLMDIQSNWKLNDLIKEHKQLVNALTHSYRKLSEFFRVHNNVSRISRRDVTLLGRKLHAAFERKAGKIEVINRAHQTQLLESHVSIHQFTTHKNVLGWKVFQNIVVSSEIDSKESLNQSVHLMKLVSWLYFNCAINSKTNIILFDKTGKQYRNNEMSLIVEQMEQVYPNALLGQSSIDVLAKAAQVENNILFINVNQDPFSAGKHTGQQIATSRTDSLKYGGMYRNLVVTIDLIYNTTWKEVMYLHYQGETGLLECICQYLRWNDDDFFEKLPTLCCSYSSERGKAIAERVNELIVDIVATFSPRSQSHHNRYLFAISKGFYLLWLENNEAKYKKIESHSALLNELSLPQLEFRPLTIDKHAIDDLVLPAIYEFNKVDRIQFFYFNRIKNVDIYILDGNGSLYHQQLSIEKQNVHINHFILFLRSVINRSLFDSSEDLTADYTEEEIDLDIYKVIRKGNDIKIERQNPNLYPLPKQFLNIQAIGDINISDQQYFSFFCDGQEFSAFDYGNAVYDELAAYVVKNRSSGLRYPVYITDMDLAPQIKEMESSENIQIIQMLKYKEQIEKKLNSAVKSV